MTATLTSISNSYMNSFPNQVPQKAAQSFVVTAAIGVISGATFQAALIAGSLAVTATLIEAITRPIIRSIFPENPQIATFIQIIIPKVVALSLATSIAPWMLTNDKTATIFLRFIAWVSLNLDFYQKNVGMVEIL